VIEGAELGKCWGLSVARYQLLVIGFGDQNVGVLVITDGIDEHQINQDIRRLGVLEGLQEVASVCGEGRGAHVAERRAISIDSSDS